MAQTVAVGGLAPEFDLPCTRRNDSPERRVASRDFRGRWLALIFYPRDFSLVCPTELTALSCKHEEFRRQGCELLGVSVDSVESHEKWIATPRAQGGLDGLNFPLASDLDGAVSRAFGVFLEYQHVALRGLFIIDPNGVVQYQVVHNLSVGRRSDEILRVLAALQTGGLCAESWSQQQPTLDATKVLRPGSMLSHYRIEEQIGTGAFAYVYRARDTLLERPVALKVIRPESLRTPQAVLAEARSAAALNHPNVCTIYSVDNSEGVTMIAMEYLSGQPLDKYLAATKPAPAEVAAIARQIAAGMAAAHAHGIVHGDLKPANIFHSDGGSIKILDFGLSRRQQSRRDPHETIDMESDGSVTGSPSYMSPEQAEGKPAAPASDTFALGAIVYEMLCGRKAFPGDNVLQVLSRIRDVSAENMAADVPAAFRPVIRATLARQASDRAIGMSELAEMLGNIEDTGR